MSTLIINFGFCVAPADNYRSKGGFHGIKDRSDLSETQFKDLIDRCVIIYKLYFPATLNRMLMITLLVILQAAKPLVWTVCKRKEE
jgi:hypothetical protein